VTTSFLSLGLYSKAYFFLIFPTLLYSSLEHLPTFVFYLLLLECKYHEEDFELYLFFFLFVVLRLNSGPWYLPGKCSTT
jgi:hypothetical protein